MISEKLFDRIRWNRLGKVKAIRIYPDSSEKKTEVKNRKVVNGKWVKKEEVAAN
jgi:hypothetical protein